ESRELYTNFLVYVFPILAVQQVYEDEQNYQKAQHIGSNPLCLQPGRFANIHQEVDQILDGSVILSRGQRTLRNILVTACPRYDLTGQWVNGRLSECRRLGTHALQTYQHVRHAHIREDRVIHTPWTALILVEGTQVGVQPVSTAQTCGQRQIGRRRTKPGSCLRSRHGTVHQLANLSTCKDQVLLVQLIGNSQVCCNTLIA